MLPSLFIAHGTPLLGLETGGYAKVLSELSSRFPKPRGIVIFSSHWEYPAQSITAVDTFELFHDFTGFPRELYENKYPVHGDIELTKRLKDLFTERKIYTSIDPTRSMDSSCYIPLQKMYPEADVPVVMLSINAHMSMSKQYDIGQALVPLRSEDILIIGSGGTVHNPEMLDFEATEPVDWAAEYDDWLVERVADWNYAELFQYAQNAPNARLAAPRSEHMIPLFLAMGAADDVRTSELVHRSYRFGSMSRIIWQFG